jgi:hypothetical protein
VPVEEQKVHHVPDQCRRLQPLFLRLVDYKVPPEPSRLPDMREGRVDRACPVGREVREGGRALRAAGGTLVVLLPLVEVVTAGQLESCFDVAATREIINLG